MTEVNFRLSLMQLLSGHADAQIITESKIEYLKNLSRALQIPLETLFANEFQKIWTERSVCNA